MAIYELTAEQIRKIPETSFGASGVRERGDLQRLLRAHIEVISPETLVIAEEFGEWEDSRRRIDLLGLDKDANLVVIELKRTEDGGHMELQAIRYAAMISTMTFERVVEVYTAYLRKLGDSSDAQAAVLEFLNWDEADDDLFARDVRIVLVSAEFSKELTTAVLWLNEREIDIRCIRIKPYADGTRVLVDVQQVIPLPEAAEYQVQIREKEQKGRRVKVERHDLRRRFWEGLLSRARGRTNLHGNISPSDYHWISVGSGFGGVHYNYTIGRWEGRVEVYIDRKAYRRKENKQIFDELHAHRSAIQDAFGDALDWERLDGKQACKISMTVAGGGYRSESSEWPNIQDRLIDAMIRLEAAFRPHLAAIKEKRPPDVETVPIGAVGHEGEISDLNEDSDILPSV